MKAKEILNSSQIEVGPLKETDIEQLKPILCQHVRDRETRVIVSDEIEKIISWMNGAVDEERGDQRHYLVARTAGGTVLGCIAWSSPDKQMLKHFDASVGESAEPLNLFVDLNSQNGGIGRKLFESMCQSVKAAGKKRLIANSGPRYKNAWTFHDRVFDKRTGYIVGKYGQGGDAMTWTKRLA